MEEERIAPQPRRRSLAERARSPQFSIGGVLGKGFSIWGRSLVTLVILMVIIYSPLILYQAVRIASGTLPEITGGFEFTKPTFWIERLLNALSTAAVIYIVFQRLRGERGGIGDSLRACMSRILPVAGAAFLYFVATSLWALGVWVFRESPPVALVVALLGIAASIYFSLLFWVTIPAVVVENLGPIDALKRSAVLTRGCKGQIFVINLVIGAVGGGAGAIVAVLARDDPEGFVIWRLVATLVFGALAATMTAVGYHDLRSAKEGVGVEELLKVFA